MTTSLPSCSSMSFVARRDPRASPSGFSWVVTRKRSWSRMASAIFGRSVSVVFVWRELIDKPGEPDAPLYRRIVLKGQLWSSLETKFPVDTGLEHSVRGLETGERRLPLRLGAQHADVDRRLPQVGARLDARDGDEADPRVLERADALREHLAERLVHPAHPAAHSSVTISRSVRPSSNAWPERYRSASSRSPCSSWWPRATQARVKRERCQTSWWSTSATAAPNRR